VSAPGLAWLRFPDGAGGVTSISGWGTVSGGQINGQNINDLLDGHATFRPGTLSLIIGCLGAAVAVAFALGERTRAHPGSAGPQRIPTAALAVLGLAGLIFGIYRGIAPDPIGLAAPGSSSGVGPWLSAGAGGAMLVVAALVLLGLLDRRRPQSRS